MMLSLGGDGANKELEVLSWAIACWMAPKKLNLGGLDELGMGLLFAD